jgi:hypothetical protein
MVTALILMMALDTATKFATFLLTIIDHSSKGQTMSTTLYQPPVFNGTFFR